MSSVNLGSVLNIKDATFHEEIFYCQHFQEDFNLIIVQQNATYSFYYISVGSSTCFGCWHPSSGARTAVITASGID